MTEMTEQGTTEEIDYTGTRRVLRYRLDFDINGLATVGVGANAVIRHAGTGTSDTVCLWVEEDGNTAAMEQVTVVALPTGAVVPEGATYLAFFIADGVAIRHLYRLA